MNTINTENMVAIYYLVDPRTPEIVRYVGQTMTPRTRHLQHCVNSGTTLKNEWIESLMQIGIMPQMKVIEWTTKDQALAQEISHIEHNQTKYLTNRIIKLNDRTANNGTIKKDNERQLIEDTLKRTGWNKFETAQLLGIGRQTLYNKIKRYKIEENLIN